ncbi:MAG: ECF transporter S component [Candidatus Delongbacteria bacterium]|nr:ECF transporter S component [Candidatus Delongbacteria bacterium]
MQKFLRTFSINELVIIGLVAALGMATKPVVVPLTHIITGPLFIPGGSLAGGFYMLWIVLGAGLVKKKGSGTVIALTQAALAIVLGIYGTHGITSLLTYTLPGIAIDVVFLFSRNYKYNIMHYFIAGAISNISGAFAVNLVIFQLPFIPLMLSLSVALFSGGLGGILAYNINSKLSKLKVLNEH